MDNVPCENRPFKTTAAAANKNSCNCESTKGRGLGEGALKAHTRGKAEVPVPASLSSPPRGPFLPAPRPAWSGWRERSLQLLKGTPWLSVASRSAGMATPAGEPQVTCPVGCCCLRGKAAVWGEQVGRGQCVPVGAAAGMSTPSLRAGRSCHHPGLVPKRCFKERPAGRLPKCR